MRHHAVRFTMLLAALAACCAPCVLARDAVQTPPEHRRGAEQTFLTFPEWYLVHSPAEYAQYLQQARHPSRFPLFAHIGQFWRAYGDVASETRDYPFNPGYHLMVCVIGTSTTVEYGLKGFYEHTVGRLAESTRMGELTPEEVFAARAAQDYVDFIRVQPWYQFDFWSRLQGLWALPLAGPDVLRRLERRYFLTSEYLVKEAYARLIKLGTRSIYDEPKPVTAIVVDAPVRPDPLHAQFEPLAAAGPGVLALVPRYEAFTEYARWLAGQGLEFQEIAGNQGEIVVSVLAAAGVQAPAVEGRVLFTQPVLTRPGLERVVFAVPVPSLAHWLRAAQGSTRIEHIYDY